MVALDATARQVACDAATFRRRLINMPIRELPAGEWPRQAEDSTLVLAVATSTGGVETASQAQLSGNGSPIAWLGPAPPPWLDAGLTAAGRFVLASGDNRCPSSWLYAGLNLLLARAWSQAAPPKARTVRRHVTAAASIGAVLNDARLLESLQEVAVANAAYRTAFFISPFASGRVWEEHFDAGGRLLVVHHSPGQTGRGPIVTIDGDAPQKYVALEKRDRMLMRYGEPDVARWEACCLAGGSVDDFLSRPSAASFERPRAPFYAGNRWYLPILQPGYDAHRDNLIILDLTAERYLPQMLDELSLLGSRVPRLVVIIQEERLREAGSNTLFRYPISDLLVLPSPGGVPIADMHLPFVLSAVGSPWRTFGSRSRRPSDVRGLLTDRRTENTRDREFAETSSHAPDKHGGGIQPDVPPGLAVRRCGRFPGGHPLRIRRLTPIGSFPFKPRTGFRPPASGRTRRRLPKRPHQADTEAPAAGQEKPAGRRCALAGRSVFLCFAIMYDKSRFCIRPSLRSPSWPFAVNRPEQATIASERRHACVMAERRL